MSRSAKTASEDAPQLGEVGDEALRRVRVRVVEQERQVGLRLRLRGRDARTHRLRRLGADRGVEVVAEDAEAAEVALVPAQALVAFLLLDALEIDVRPWVVRSRVRRRAVRDRFDERRATACARTLDRLSGRFEHGEYVAAVD